MELSKQIKKYREEKSLSQDELANQLYVSRQTISNWENEKSYPDVHNLLLLSAHFDVSLDELVKGDVERMKEKISKVEMKQYSTVMLILMLLLAISTGIIVFFKAWWWLIIPVACWLVYMGLALKVEKMKKTADIKTYREIAAFMENRNLDEIRKQRNDKRYTVELLGIIGIVVLIFLIITFIAGIIPSFMV